MIYTLNPSTQGCRQVSELTSQGYILRLYLKTSRNILLFFFNYACVSMSEYRYPQRPEESISPETGVIGSCELPDMGARTLTWVL